MWCSADPTRAFPVTDLSLHWMDRALSALSHVAGRFSFDGQFQPRMSLPNASDVRAHLPAGFPTYLFKVADSLNDAGRSKCRTTSCYPTAAYEIEATAERNAEEHVVVISNARVS